MGPGRVAFIGPRVRVVFVAYVERIVVVVVSIVHDEPSAWASVGEVAGVPFHLRCACGVYDRSKILIKFVSHVAV